MEVYTIGFAKRRAPEFFGALRTTGIKRLLNAFCISPSLCLSVQLDAQTPFLPTGFSARLLHDPILRENPLSSADSMNC